jgi:hypothetical protein
MTEIAFELASEVYSLSNAISIVSTAQKNPSLMVYFLSKQHSKGLQLSSTSSPPQKGELKTFPTSNSSPSFSPHQPRYHHLLHVNITARNFFCFLRITQILLL